MTSGWVLRFTTFCAAYACGCETDRIHPHALHADAGHDAASGGGGHGGSSGAPNVGGAPRADSGLLCEEATTSSLPDGATTGADCGAGHASTADAGAPPARCALAPCLWELMKHCLPRRGCTQHSYRAESGRFADVSCDASSDWWVIRSGFNVSSYRWTEDVYVGDCLCYSFAAEGRVNYISEWTDSAHRVVARSTGYPIARVICGPFESLASPNDFILSSGELAPGFTEHPVDLADPECGPWTNPTSRCEPGCCSGTPPKLPQTPN